MFRRGAFCLLQRNFTYFRYTIWVSLLWVVVEPLLFLYAIGYGLGMYVGEIEGASYAEFFYPAIMMASAMMVAFYETTYSTFTKLTRQQTFHSILLTPVMPRDIGYGELWWAACKGTMSSIGVVLAATLHGLVGTLWVLPALLISFLLAWIFAAFGLFVTTHARNYDYFIYSQTGLMMPLYFFSGTYFPLTHLPVTVQKLAWLSPLTHAVQLARQLVANDFDLMMVVRLGLLAIGAVVLTRISVRRLEERLIL